MDSTNPLSVEKIGEIKAKFLQTEQGKWIRLTGEFLHSNRTEEFYETSCHLTTNSLIDHFFGADYSLVEEPPKDSIFGVNFDDEHLMMKIGNKIVQSYAFVSKTTITDYDPNKSFLDHSIKHEELKDCEITYLIKNK
jgi:hypothetical protein